MGGERGGGEWVEREEAVSGWRERRPQVGGVGEMEVYEWGD